MWHGEPKATITSTKRQLLKGEGRTALGEERGLGNDKWPGSCPRKADERDAIGGDTVMRGTDGLGDWGRAAGE